MRRGDVVWVDLEPTLGAEADKRRPAIVVSNDGANHTATQLGRGVVTVVPLTSSTRRIYPFQILVTAEESSLPRSSKAQAEQIRSVAIERISEPVGRLPSPVMDAVDTAVRLHLGL